MIKRLLLLNGLAITAVVANHADAFGLLAALQWPNPNLCLVGGSINIEQFFLLIIGQLCVFSVPAFMFTSGFFVAYASKGPQGRLRWRTVKERIIHLLIPYAIWSLIALLFLYLQGNTYSPSEILRMFFIDGVLPLYGFIPALSYLYILSPFLIFLAKRRWILFLLLSAAIQFSGVMLHYLRRYGLAFPGLDNLLYLTEPWLPTMWIFYFALGITLGLHLGSIKPWLERNRLWIFSTLGLTIILIITESLLRFDPSSQQHFVYFGTFSFVFYSVSFILSFLLLPQIPLTRYFSYVGPKTLGIFLIHYLVIVVIAKSIIEFAPSLLLYRILLVTLLVLVGISGPLLGMKLLRSSPIHRYYRFIFG